MTVTDLGDLIKGLAREWAPDHGPVEWLAETEHWSVGINRRPDAGFWRVLAREDDGRRWVVDAIVGPDEGRAQAEAAARDALGVLSALPLCDARRRLVPLVDEAAVVGH